ncbi:DUF397 domain-containing protein [Streptomyces sp. BYX5S]
MNGTAAELTWFKSTYSGDEGGQCLEVAFADAIHIRDSKNDPATGPTLSVGTRAWAAFAEFAGA